MLKAYKVKYLEEEEAHCNLKKIHNRGTSEPSWRVTEKHWRTVFPGKLGNVLTWSLVELLSWGWLLSAYCKLIVTAGGSFLRGLWAPGEEGRFLVCLWFFFFFWPHCGACGILVPRPGIGPTPSHWKLRVLNTGPPGKSPHFCVLDSSTQLGILLGIQKTSVWFEVEVKGLPGGAVVENPRADAGDADFIPGPGRSPGEGNGNPL